MLTVRLKKSVMTSASTFESLRPLACVLLVFTIFLTGMFSIAFGFMSLLMAFSRGMMGDSPVRLDRILWLGAAIVIPALFLIPFYFAAATRHITALRGMLGWISSLLYYAAMTWLLVFYMPATTQFFSIPIPLPNSIFTGSACLVSIYVLIRLQSLKR